VGNRCEICAASTQEHYVPPEANSIMDEIGIDLSRLCSNSIDDATGQEFDYVISVGVNNQACPNVSGNPRRLHWPVRERAMLSESEEKRLAAFREIRDRLHARIMILAGDLAYSTWISQAENHEVKAVSDPLNRPDLVKRGKRMEYFTIGWNNREGLLSIIARSLGRGL
jgi:arsenate reductase